MTSLAELQQWLVRRGVKMTMDEINEIVHEVRRETARAMQLKSAAARWAGKSTKRRSQEMRQLRAKAKKRRKTRKPNARPVRPAPAGTHEAVVGRSEDA